MIIVRNDLRILVNKRLQLLSELVCAHSPAISYRCAQIRLAWGGRGEAACNEHEL